MNRALPFILVTSLFLLGAPRADAVVCALDQVPGATLLLPYFEVDLGAPSNGLFVNVHNSSPQPVLTHVVIWSDLAVAVLDFDLYLKGQGSVEIDLKSLLLGGLLPQTPLDPGAFPTCANVLPLSPLPAAFVDHLQKSLTGKRSAILNGCAGRDLGDNVARGYLTIDTVRQCNNAFPNEPGYFKNGGQGIATNQNVLWGDSIRVDAARHLALGQGLIALKASGSDPQTSKPDQYTFYGRFVGWSGADNREPLATLYGARLLGGPAATDGTDLVVWRDPRSSDLTAFQCPATAGRPGWFPLPARVQVADDSGHSSSVGNLLFPAATQRVNLQRALPSLPVSGTLRLDLNTRTAARVPAGPAEAPTAAQGWVTALAGDQGTLVVDLGSVRYDSACEPGQALH